MSLNFLYWASALAILGAAMVCGLFAWRAIRGGRRGDHAKLMNTAVVLVLAFLLSYPLKLIFLGRENLQQWSGADVTVLRIHETFVFFMLVTGAAARLLARRLRNDRLARASQRIVSWHRWCGRSAVVFSVLGFVTAAMILLGMFHRLG